MQKLNEKQIELVSGGRKRNRARTKAPAIKIKEACICRGVPDEEGVSMEYPFPPKGSCDKKCKDLNSIETPIEEYCITYKRSDDIDCNPC